ncbi:MAG: DUF5682 family protein [Treponema sp.]|nr:DUF5682 family protein [Treponema sp.]
MSSPFYFGIRHLSPAASVELKKFLDSVKPELVLIEGPSDLNDKIDYITNPDVKFPIAIMAYTKRTPVKSILYPFAEYSPEIQALLWAKKNNVKCAFMDMPSSAFLAFPDTDSMDFEEASKDVDVTENVYAKLEMLTGESHDCYWERNFEQLAGTGLYREACNTFGREIRKSENASGKYNAAETLIREAFMKRTIESAIKQGIAAEKIVCVCGAFHVGGLETNTAMTDEELNNLPCVESSSTLMPYSFYRLSAFSGYGAGNSSPSYYQMLYKAMSKINKTSSNKDECMEEIFTKYLVSVAKNHRDSGNIVSSASVIEALRLAKSVALIRGSKYPVLQDLHDAMIATIGHGNFSEIVEACTKVEVNPVVGFLPKGMSVTAIQDDFMRNVEKLNLNDYLSESVQAFCSFGNKKKPYLDLRENRYAAKENAFQDLNTSFFFHRLEVLGVAFASYNGDGGEENINYKEYWQMKWTPEVEMQLVENAVLGDSIVSAAVFKIKELADSVSNISEASEIFEKAYLCGLPESCDYVLKIMQAFLIDENALVSAADTSERLSSIVRYGDIRKYDSKPLLQMLEKLYLRSCLVMKDACICDDENAKTVIKAMDKVNSLQLNHDFLEESKILDLLKEISVKDNLNPKCSGFAMALLLERGKADENVLSNELSLRLSKGMPVDLGAAWIEGLSAKNHYTLIARLSLWEKIASYIEELDDDEFKRAVVALRRTFSEFSKNEKCDIAENLGEIWGFNKDQVADVLTHDMNVEEQKKLDELNDFDFDDI